MHNTFTYTFLEVLVRSSENNTVHSVTIENLYTEDFELVTMADLVPGASLNMNVNEMMCPCEFIKGTVFIFCSNGNVKGMMQIIIKFSAVDQKGHPRG